MSAAEPVRHGTADALARLHHFRQLTDALPEAHELDPVIRFLIGAVTDPGQVLEHLGDELDLLWSLLTEDYDIHQLDELTDDDWARFSFPTAQQETDHRWATTVVRLVGDIEGHIRMARERRAERCPSCRGNGGWQQPSGLIVECPRGCMTGERAA